MRHYVLSFARWMGTTGSYLVVSTCLLLSTLSVFYFGLNSPVSLAIIFFLSAFSILQTSTILVEQKESADVARKRDDALHKKIDGLILGVPKADNALIGIESEYTKDMKTQYSPGESQ